MDQRQLEGARLFGQRLGMFAPALTRTLTELAEDPEANRHGGVAWCMVMHAHGTAQWLSNCKRADGRRMISELLARWDAGREDLPAQANPELKVGAVPKDVTINGDRAEHYANVLQTAIGCLRDGTPGSPETIVEVVTLLQTLQGDIPA
jgi:hypothetical protein